MTKQTIHTTPISPDHEIIIKLKCGAFDWIDPIEEVWIDNGTLYVDNIRYVYAHKLSDIVDYNIRPYRDYDVYDYRGGNL